MLGINISGFRSGVIIFLVDISPNRSANGLNEQMEWNQGGADKRNTTDGNKVQSGK